MPFAVEALMQLLLSFALALVGVAAVPAADAAAPPPAPLEAVQLSAPEYRAAVESLAGAYTFAVAEGAGRGCVVRLLRAPVQTKRRAGLPVAIDAGCRRRFPVLRAVVRWQPTGGGSLRLLGGAPFRELSDFSPVQDGSGVYVRGGFAGAPQVYELRARGR